MTGELADVVDVLAGGAVFVVQPIAAATTTIRPQCNRNILRQLPQLLVSRVQREVVSNM